MIMCLMGQISTSNALACGVGRQAEPSDCIELEEATPALQQKVSQLDAA